MRTVETNEEKVEKILGNKEQSIKHQMTRYLPNQVDNEATCGNGITIHPYSIVVEGVRLGDNVTIWSHCNVFGDTVIGNNVTIGSHTEIAGAKIGDNVTIGHGCYLPEGVVIHDNVWIAPFVHITNDKYPPAKKNEWLPDVTIIESGAVIGMDTTIVGGVTIGRGAFIGAKSLINKDVTQEMKLYGIPAKERGYAK